ncbi:MAG TPA: 1-deoxy-D-xylulose-5-phosphate reductoisomerase [Candidatus Dormibacteraeota bacterium]|nr:1-deoxy-D-xylulose-5-phosphate reductoisomerase [Candidatus Dormibacteraeota bacterium]
MTRAPASPKRLALLGATGSIGRQVCDLVERYPERFCLRTAVAGRDAAGLEALGRRHPGVRTLLAAVGQDQAAVTRSIEDAMRDPEVDLVVVAVSGSAALGPTLAALDAGKDIALATKEVLVMAGELVRDRMRRHGSRLLPVDSEHSAIWQCLWGEQRSAVEKLVLTGSGGPFLRRPVESLESVSVAEALNHPRWHMGPKITVDSATMMNKGLEIIEAHYLFDVPFSMIEVLVHPQSVVHSMVQFVDGSVKAQLGVPDMHLPIAVALGYPDRLPGVTAPPELATIRELTFEPVDDDRYPAISLARRAGEAGGTAPAILNAANEVAVELFLNGRLRFVEIIPAVRSCLGAAATSGATSLEAVLNADAWARLYVENWRPGPVMERSKRPA